MTAMPSVAIKQKFHPRFNNLDADIILSSKDETLYRIHRTILRSASGFLEPFLSDTRSTKEDPNSPPLAHSIAITDTEIIKLPFSDGPLERVFLMMTLQKVPPVRSIQELEEAVEVMEYLDTEGLLTHMQAFCFAPVLRSEPIRLYSIGAKFGWEDVMQYAAEHSLHLNLLPSTEPEATEMENQLARLDSRSYHRLLKLHRRRRDTFRAFLKEKFLPPQLCRQCSCSPSGSSRGRKAWEALILRLVWEIEKNPTGETVLSSLDADDKNSRTCRGCNAAGIEYWVDVEATVKRGIAVLPTHLA